MKHTSAGLILGKTIRCYERKPEYGIVLGGVLSLHSTKGFPVDLTLDIFKESLKENNFRILINPYDLMYEICSMHLYDLGEEVGKRWYKEDWSTVYTKMTTWAAKHFTLYKTQADSGDEEWSLMLDSMRAELEKSILACDTELSQQLELQSKLLAD